MIHRIAATLLTCLLTVFLVACQAQRVPDMPSPLAQPTTPESILSPFAVPILTPTGVQPGGGPSLSAWVLGSTILVSWHGVPDASNEDWVTVAIRGSPTGAYKDWAYTSSCGRTPSEAGKASGECRLAVPPPGKAYEARLMTKNPAFRCVAASSPFESPGVRDNAPHFLPSTRCDAVALPVVFGDVIHSEFEITGYAADMVVTRDGRFINVLDGSETTPLSDLLPVTHSAVETGVQDMIPDRESGYVDVFYASSMGMSRIVKMRIARGQVVAEDQRELLAVPYI